MKILLILTCLMALASPYWTDWLVDAPECADCDPKELSALIGRSLDEYESSKMTPEAAAGIVYLFDSEGNQL